MTCHAVMGPVCAFVPGCDISGAYRKRAKCVRRRTVVLFHSGVIKGKGWKGTSLAGRADVDLNHLSAGVPRTSVHYEFIIKSDIILRPAPLL
jgi:hypothetical protein